MRYICRDIDNNQNLIQQLFKPSNIIDNNINEDGIKLNLTFTDDVKNQGIIYYYGHPGTKKYFQIKNYYKNSQTIETFSSWAEIETINNFDSTYLSKGFIFDLSKLLQIKSNMFITIFGNNKLYLLKPYRLSTSKLINSENYKIIGSHINNKSNYNIQNELADYNINQNNDCTVKPTLIDDTIKNYIMNYEAAINDIIYIQSGLLFEVFDYLFYNGKTYLIVSQKRENNQYVYSCIRESNETFTFTGSDIIYSDQFINVNENMIAYNSFEIGQEINFEISPGASLFVEDINKDTTIYEYYNLVETLTNKYWIDGRRIYRKVINFGTLPNATTKSIAHNIAGFTVTSTGTFRLINLYGIALSPTNYFASLPIIGNTNPGFLIYVDATNINITVNANWTSYTETYITLEYVR